MIRETIEPLVNIELEKQALVDSSTLIGQSMNVFPNDKDLFNYELNVLTVMKDLGSTLKTYLSSDEGQEALKSADEQFKLSIKLSFELAKCHEGFFLSGKGRAHRDLKSSNITYVEGKVHFIDWGLAKEKPNEMVEPCVGTIPYIEIPFEDYLRFNYQCACKESGYKEPFKKYRQDHGGELLISFDNGRVTDKRSGVFFDLEALRRILRSKLCLSSRHPDNNKVGIISEKTIDEFKLAEFLSSAYQQDSFCYLDASQIRVKDAWTLTAVLIASQVKLSEEEINEIINNKDLAISIVGSYFSNQTDVCFSHGIVDWPYHGAMSLREVLALNNKDWRQRANLVTLGLSHHLNEALEDEYLVRMLEKGCIGIDKKRALACLFKKGVWKAPQDYLQQLKEHKVLTSRILFKYEQGCEQQDFFVLLARNEFTLSKERAYQRQKSSFLR